MLTLWDLLKNVIHPRPPRPPRPPLAQPARPPRRAQRQQRPPTTNPTTSTRRRRAAPPGAAPAPGSMEERYERITRDLLARHRIRVRRWRTAMTGIAWEVRYRDGSVARLIEAPRPRGPMSAAVFLHEVGHHVIGFDTYRPRCLEEYHAWAFSLATMEALGLNITDAVRRRMHLSLKYAVDKARRRGLRALPPELEPFTRPWPGPTPSNSTPSASRRPAPRRRAQQPARAQHAPHALHPHSPHTPPARPPQARPMDG